MSTYKYFFKGCKKDNQYSFFNIPFVLLNKKLFPISLRSKVLYALLDDRRALSVKNREKFADDQGRIYILYPVNEMMKKLNLSKNTCLRLLDELEDFGLICRVQNDSFNRKNIIYVKNFNSILFRSEPDEDEKFAYYTSRYEEEQASHSSIRVPHILVEKQEAIGITIDAVILYSLLLVREGVSLENETFADKEGKVYIYYPVNDIAEKLGLGRKKVLSLLSSLDDKDGGAGLIHIQKEEGFNSSNRIYVKDFAGAGEDMQENEGASEDALNEENISSQETIMVNQQEKKKKEENSYETPFSDEIIAETVEILQGVKKGLTKVSKKDLRRSQKGTYEGPKKGLTKVPKRDLRRSQKGTCEGVKKGLTKVPKRDPNITYSNIPNNYSLHKSNEREDNLQNAIQFNSTPEMKRNEMSFADRFSESVSLATFLREDYFGSISQEVAEEIRVFNIMFNYICAEIESGKEAFTVKTMKYSRERAIEILLSCNSFDFQELYNRIKSNTTKINDYGSYLVATLISIHENAILDSMRITKAVGSASHDQEAADENRAAMEKAIARDEEEAEVKMEAWKLEKMNELGAGTWDEALELLGFKHLPEAAM